MTGMALLVCCGWTVLLCLSVQAYGNVDIYIPFNELNTIVLGIRILNEDEEISVKGTL